MKQKYRSIIFGCLFIPLVLSQSKVKPIKTHLNAKWFDTSFIHEAAEYLAEDNLGTYWAYIEEINKMDLNAYLDSSDKQKFAMLLKVSSIFLSEEQLKILKFALGLRIYSPKVEMFRQISIEQGIEAKQCQTAVDIEGDIVCDIKDITAAVDKNPTGHSNVFDVDHVFQSGKAAKTVAILYGELGTKGFKEFHEHLKNLSLQNKIKYVVRPYVQNPGKHKVRLSGYGVELQIKSTEYKAQDDTKIQEDSEQIGANQEEMRELDGFVFSKLKDLYPEKATELKALSDHLMESAHDLAPMKVWQLQHLSMQAAQNLMSLPQEEVLTGFTQTATNFPLLARSLTRTKVGEKMKREILKNQNTLRSEWDLSPSDAALFINGMQFDLDYTDIYTLLDYIRDEQKVVEGLHRLGISGDTLKSLVQLDLVGEKMEYGIDIRDSAIFWLNNIETDSAYRRWPQSTGELLRPAFPGSLRSIRKNFHNLVLLVDPASKETKDMFRLAETFLTHIAPVRFGVVFAVNSDKKITGYDDAGVAMLNAFNFVSQTHDGENANFKGLQFISELLNSVPSVLKPSDVTNFFKQKYKNEDLDDIFGVDSDYDVGRQLSTIFIDKGGFKKFPQALMNGIPLPEKSLSGDELEESILMEVMKNTHLLRKVVMTGELHDGKDVIDWFMSQPNIMPRLNNRILSSVDSQFLDMSSVSEINENIVGTYSQFERLQIPQMTSAISKSCHYIATKSEFASRPLTVWVSADYETEGGRNLLLHAIKFTRESNGVRICGLHNTESPGYLSKIIQVAHSSLPSAVARQFLVKILDPSNAQKLKDGTKSVSDFFVQGMDKEAFEARLAAINGDIFKSHSLYSTKALSMSNGQSTLVVNGKIMGALNENETFTEEDFALMENYFLNSIGNKVLELLSGQPQSVINDLIMKVTAVLQSKVHIKPRVSISLKSEQFSVLKLNAQDPQKPAFDIIAICDPVSKAAQKTGPLLQVLHKVLNANVKIILNSVEKHSEMPLKSFYRYVLQSEPQFTSDGHLSAGPNAQFVGLPESTIFTQSFHVPENWLVEVVKSLYDLDNIKLEQVESAVNSEFELEHLLLEGHCFEQATGNPPRGLQFTLGTKHNPVQVDTIVMANLGYFQLKANPGAMVLKLREGRSADIYNIASHEGTDSSKEGSDVNVVISSFRSQVVKVKVAKKPEMADQDLMGDDDTENNGGLWGSIANTFSGGSEDNSKDDTINIFSVASGHLYERFLRIMTVSVKKHTKSKVKFWFIKNFLSPNFKDSLPILAKEFDFEYELVQYKWPRWLHQQTEKQRVIWGYKILFLDVLFPLHVTKIIFVDADQVVRDDIRKLYDLDLDGAPYGFVPFCDSRKEMEGFRFWKQGYWRNHLAGRKYHISALFVVDLKRFRRIAAGDRLRGQYQGLSQDPNSLSNLDQDLPNNMIHQVRIKSLPMEWLWCETWCDDYSKSSAKIIDVCNNPQTKEAKLDAANRIIDEWSEYDNIIKSLLQHNTTVHHKENHAHTEL